MLNHTLMCVANDVITGSVPVCDVICNILKCLTFKVPKTRSVYERAE